MASMSRVLVKSIYNASTGMSSLRVVYGREAPTIIKYVKEGTRVQEVDQLLYERDIILEELKGQLCKAQNSAPSGLF